MTDRPDLKEPREPGAKVSDKAPVFKVREHPVDDVIADKNANAA